MQTPTIYDVVVIGAGIAGASLAYRLADEVAVLLLEREMQPGYHSTGRSAAMFMETYGTPQICALTRASRAFYSSPPAHFTEHPIITPRGCLYIASHEQQALLEPSYHTLIASGTEVQRISAHEAHALVPSLKSDIIHAGLYETDACDMDVHALHQGFLKGFKQRGGHLECNAEVVSGHYSHSVWTLELKNGIQIQAKKIVNASGAWADELAVRCGIRPIGLQPCRRSAFTFDGPTHLSFSHWPAVVGIDESYYFKPDAGQLLGSPANADPVIAHDVVPEELDIATGIHHINAISDLDIRRPKHIWAGLRSFVKDGDLVIGEEPEAEQFFWLAAQGGYGIQSAAGASELAVHLILNRPLSKNLLEYGVHAEKLSPRRLRT